jgi:hypothetical protein
MRSTAARSRLALRLSFSLRPASRHPSGPCSLLWSIPMVKLIAIDGTAARALRCLRRGSSKFSLWRGNNSLRRLHNEEDFRHRCARHIADKRRDRCAGAIQSESDGGHRHGGEPRTDAVRSLYPWGSRVWVLAALAPPMALVSPALVICRNGFQRRYCNQLLQSANVVHDRFGSSASHRCALVVRLSRLAGAPAEEKINEPTGRFLRPRVDMMRPKLLASAVVS